jgi:hypothetical protein
MKKKQYVGGAPFIYFHGRRNLNSSQPRWTIAKTLKLCEKWKVVKSLGCKPQKKIMFKKFEKTIP